MKRFANAVCAVALVVPLATACGVGGSAGVAHAPRCSSVERVALIAQSVPSASYVPCLAVLPAGWRSGGLVVQDGSTHFQLSSDRAPGRAVQVDFGDTCDPSAGAPIPPRTVGGRTYLALRSIDPRFTGTMYDVFPGGCVTYRFDFQRGPHIALMAELESSVGFRSRAALRLQLRQRLGVDLR